MTIKDRLSLTLFGEIGFSAWTMGIILFLALCWAWPVAQVADALIYRQPPISYIEAYAPKPDVAPGGQVEVRFDVDRHRICPVINVSRAVVDASGLEHVVLGYTRAPQTRPGREVYDRIITVPETVPPGKAWYVIRLEYGCNFLNYWGWPIRVESPRVPLNVLPGRRSRPDFVPMPQVDPMQFDDKRDG